MDNRHLGHNGLWHEGAVQPCPICAIARRNICSGCGRPRTMQQIKARRRCDDCEAQRRGPVMTP